MTPPTEPRPVPRLVMGDWFCGIGGASAGFLARRWRVVRLDCDPSSVADVVADACALPFRRFHLDFLWCSPPCDEFSSWRQPWRAHAAAPDRRLVDAALAAVAFFRPRYWLIENVEAAQMYLGRPRAVFGSLWLWGEFPWIGNRYVHVKGGWGGGRAQYRGATPYPLSYRLALALERCLR